MHIHDNLPIVHQEAAERVASWRTARTGIWTFLIKGLKLDGPVLLPVEEDLPYLARPFTPEEKAQALQAARSWGLDQIEDTAPVSFIGTGATLNEATANGLQRAAIVLGISVPEVMNRATITGSIDIGRDPGVITVTFLAPVPLLEQAGLADVVLEHYQLRY